MPYAARGSYRCFRAGGEGCVVALHPLDIRPIPGPQLAREIAGQRARKHHGQAAQCLYDERKVRSKLDRIQYCVSPNTRPASAPVFLLSRRVCRSSVKGTKLEHGESKVDGPFFSDRLHEGNSSDITRASDLVHNRVIKFYACQAVAVCCLLNSANFLPCPSS